MMVLFYAIIMTGLLLLLFNKDGILSLIPTTHVAGRTTLVLTYRFYPLLLLLVLGLFGVYVWGYINLAAYLTLGISLTLLLVSLAAGLYRLAWVFGLWMFGFSKGQTGLVQVEKKWARNLLRLFRVSVGVLLTLVSVGLLLEIWRVGGGLSAFGRLFVTPFLQIKDTQITLLSLGKLLLSLVVAFWLSKWLRKNCREYLYPALRMSNANQHAANTVLGHAILIIGTLFGFQWMGVGIGVLAVFAGVVGIGVGFGIQNIASNFISGLIITFGQPIKVGDLIEVDGVMGEVKEVSGRSTTIETFDLRIVLIPNSEILTKKVINWSMGRPCVMVKLGVGVAYGSDVKLALETLLAVAKDHPLVLSEPSPALRFGDFGASSLDLSIWVAVADPLRRFEVISDMRLEVDRRFQELDITIAFPQQDVHLHPSLEDAMIHAMKAHSQGALAQASPGTSTVPTRPIKE
jgi:small-conductance mechanosensitive channel